MPASLRCFCPAKINLLLAITGPRDDGFHDLISLVAPLAFGDDLTVSLAPKDALRCDDPAVPLDESNLVLQAAKLFREHAGRAAGFAFELTKRIPMGAGLGGGSSNAALALRAMNQLTGEPFAASELERLAAEIGSDCPLFLRDKALIMRGRGERIEALPDHAGQALAGRKLLLCKPSCGISTGWAYGQLRARAPGSYADAANIEGRLSEWLADPAGDLPLFNNMEPPAFTKYRALPALRELIAAEFGLDLLMSGSGSCCFVPLPAAGAPSLPDRVKSAWGSECFCVETEIRQ